MNRALILSQLSDGTRTRDLLRERQGRSRRCYQFGSLRGIRNLLRRNGFGCRGLQSSELFGPTLQLPDGSSSRLVERILPRQLAG
jgi:hypothetical protein